MKISSYHTINAATNSRYSGCFKVFENIFMTHDNLRYFFYPLKGRKYIRIIFPTQQ